MYIQFIYLLGGGTLSTQLNENTNYFRLDDQEFAMLIKTGQIDKSFHICSKSQHEISVLNIPADRFRDILKLDEQLADLEQKLFNSDCIYPIKINKDLKDALDEIEHLETHKPEFLEELLFHKTQELLILSLEAYTTQLAPHSSTHKKSALEKMEAICQHLNAYPEKHHTLKDLATHISSNTTFIKTNFKHIYTETVFEYLKRIRMERAYKLLESTSLSISEIANGAGYLHATHFTSAFKKHYGILPKNVKSKL